MISYNGFNIDERTFAIYQGTRQIFTGSWQQCNSLEEAKLMIDYSNQAKLNHVRKKDLGKAFRTFVDSNPVQEQAEDFERWARSESQKQLNEIL
jgi:hypothetical protein